MSSFFDVFVLLSANHVFTVRVGQGEVIQTPSYYDDYYLTAYS